MTTPTPEAIEAAEAGMYQRMTWASLHWNALDPDQQRELATAALTAAYPLIAAEVLRDTAKDFAEGEWVDALIEAENDVETVVAVDEWLNHRAETIAQEVTP